MNRWWIYQRERFPLFAHGPLIAAFSASAVTYSALLRGAAALPPAWPFVVAFILSLGSFLQLRIADEFKDAAEDARHRPYRPVPRGLVTLRELGGIGIAVAVLQLALAASIGWAVIALLALAWTYFALMTREFFAREWLKARPVVYLFSHMGIMPLVDWTATGCDWVRAGEGMPAGLGWFLAASFCNGLVIELGRKLRAPAQEEPGVPTYTALWGRPVAVAAWLAALAATAACAVPAAALVGFAAPVATTLGVLFVAAAVLALAFLRAPRPALARALEASSGLWTLALYLALGPAAWLLRS